MAKSRAILAADPAPYEASVAHQAIGMLQREFGDLDAATGELRSALRLARTAGSGDRQADVLATLGVALIYRGQSGPGLAALGSSLKLVAGAPAARVLVRRGIALWILGRHREALDDLRRGPPAPRAGAAPLRGARAAAGRTRRPPPGRPRPAVGRRHHLGGPDADRASPRSSRLRFHPASRDRSGPGRTPVRHHQSRPRGRLHLAQSRARRVPLRRRADGAGPPR